MTLASRLASEAGEGLQALSRLIAHPVLDGVPPQKPSGLFVCLPFHFLQASTRLGKACSFHLHLQPLRQGHQQ